MAIESRNCIQSVHPAPEVSYPAGQCAQCPVWAADRPAGKRLWGKGAMQDFLRRQFLLRCVRRVPEGAVGCCASYPREGEFCHSGS